jgi:hypothetical protein
MLRNSLIVFLFLITIICTNLFAQGNYQDVLYLKNGSIIHGMIIEQTPGKSLTIKTANNDVFVFSFDEIDKMTKEQLPENEPIKTPTLPRTTFYSNISRIGFLSGESSNIFSINTVNGIRIKQNFALGFGLGYEKYPDRTAIPLFIDTRYCPLKGDISPIIFGDLGYSVINFDDITGSKYGGFMFNLGTGLRIRTNTSFSFLIELGYKYQKAKDWYSELHGYWVGNDWIPWYDSGYRDVHYDFLSLAIGLSF